MELNNARYISGGGEPKGSDAARGLAAATSPTAFLKGLPKNLLKGVTSKINLSRNKNGRALAAAKPIGAFVMGIPSNAAKALAKKASNLAKDAGSKIKDAGSKIKALFHGNNGGPTPATTVPPQ